MLLVGVLLVMFFFAKVKFAMCVRCCVPLANLLWPTNLHEQVWCNFLFLSITQIKEFYLLFHYFSPITWAHSNEQTYTSNPDPRAFLTTHRRRWHTQDFSEFRISFHHLYRFFLLWVSCFNHVNQFSKQTSSHHGLFSSVFRLMTCSFTLVHTLIPFTHSLVHVLIPFAYARTHAHSHHNTHAHSHHNHVLTIANYERTHTHTFRTRTRPRTYTYSCLA